MSWDIRGRDGARAIHSLLRLPAYSSWNCEVGKKKDLQLSPSPAGNKGTHYMLLNKVRPQQKGGAGGKGQRVSDSAVGVKNLFQYQHHKV